MEQIDYELSGFFYGDGCCQIIRQKRRRKYKDKTYEFINYVPRISVSQRDDNLPALISIQKRYGGFISKNSLMSKVSNPVSYWTLQSFEGVKRVTDIMKKTKVPFVKVKAVKALNDFVTWRLKIGFRKFTKEETKKIEKWHEIVHKANTYSRE